MRQKSKVVGRFPFRNTMCYLDAMKKRAERVKTKWVSISHEGHKLIRESELPTHAIGDGMGFKGQRSN